MQVNEYSMILKWKNNGSQIIRLLKKNNMESLILEDIMPNFKLKSIIIKRN